MKDHLLSITRKQVEDLASLQRSIKAVSTNRISRQSLLDAGAATARYWFDVVKPALEKAHFPQETIDAFSRRFEELLRAASKEPMKRAYLENITDNLGAYRQQIVHQIEIGSFSTTAALSIAP